MAAWSLDELAEILAEMPKVIRVKREEDEWLRVDCRSEAAAVELDDALDILIGYKVFRSGPTLVVTDQW